MKLQHILLLVLCTTCFTHLKAQEQKKALWHNIEREVHYKPDGGDFVLVSGKRRFNRALYGGNTAFRVEAGDLPEFALYLPGMGGNLKFGLIKGAESKWLIDAAKIETRYRPGSMLYEVKDALLGSGSINITALALYEREGLLIKIETKNVSKDVQLLAVYGGATGTKFSRDGDIGADPESSFYLKPEYCLGNVFEINKNSFKLLFGVKALTEEERYEIQHKQITQDSSKKATDFKTITGLFPSNALLQIGDAKKQETPLDVPSSTSNAPVLTAKFGLKDSVYYLLIQNKESAVSLGYEQLHQLFQQTEKKRRELAERIKISTPDSYINTLGGVLGTAADAVWEDPSFMHGAIAWRMRLNGWRGAYAADVLGWHARAKMHFESYSKSQLTSPMSAPVVMDTALHLARGLEKLGTSLFSSGYISRNPNGDFRPHHYDMNLVFVDQLLNHFMWTGDTTFMRKMWPLLTRHLDWEKRNFDADGDGLYDSYAAIWASDALQYSGGGVTHSSAYNYRSNLMAARIAKMLGEDGTPYQQEADKILHAIQTHLWMKNEGWYAEYEDLLGEQLLHPAAGLWTVYHAIDSKVPDVFQAWQSLYYIDKHIPHIPIRLKDFGDTSLYTLSLTNWQPYTWSLNNVALAELLHTSLAYWQGGRSEDAFLLWKSSLMESMYFGASPGSIQQLSFYDAMRGELYRDFADPIAMAGRSAVEGLFGILPDALQKSLTIQPGFPAAWNHASITTPDIHFSFKRKDKEDHYSITPHFSTSMNLVFNISARLDEVEKIVVNGREAKWKQSKISIAQPVLQIEVPFASKYDIVVIWKGHKLEQLMHKKSLVRGETIHLQSSKATIVKICDPQEVLSNVKREDHAIKASVNTSNKAAVFFVQLKQGQFTYWVPLSFDVVNPFHVFKSADNTISIKNNTSATFKGHLIVNHTGKHELNIPPQEVKMITIPASQMVSGSNHFKISGDKSNHTETVIDWETSNTDAIKFEKLNIAPFFNDAVINIFKQQYLSPRPKVSTLQLPTQGIGNWAYPLVEPAINDSGLRRRAGPTNEIVVQGNIPFSTPSLSQKNIVFTSQWDNYPDSVQIPLVGKASHLYLLMAGSTNPMQSRIVNAEVAVAYKDGSTEILQLKNPENWWPIEQDYYEDGFAFTTDAPKPIRIHLKSGIDTRNFSDYTTIKGFTTKAIDGGAATVLDLPLIPGKELKNLTIKAVANDVVIGLMSVTLVRP